MREETMYPALLARFVTVHRERLRGSTVQRIVCVGDGLVLEMQSSRGRDEIGLLGPRRAAWAYCWRGDARAALHAALAGPHPDLVTTVPALLGLRWPEATALDALRAWLVRPMPAPPAWQQVEGATLRDLRSTPDDRRLWLELDRLRPTDTARFTLLAELFDRGDNFLLRDDSGTEIANWSGRRPAPEARHHDTPATTAAATIA